MEVQYFGAIDIAAVEDYYQADVPFDDSTLSIDLNFEETTASEDALTIVDSYLKDIPNNLKKALTAIGDDWDLNAESETARFFVQHHVEEFPPETVKTLFGDAAVTRDSLLDALVVERVGFYPEDDDSFVIVDVVFKNKVSNYIMAVTLDRRLKLSEISMDS